MNKLKFKRANDEKDIIIILIIIISIGLLLLEIDLFEKYLNFTNKHEIYEIDELIFLLLTLVICLLWYSQRRKKEIEKLKNELDIINSDLKRESLKKDIIILEQSKMSALEDLMNNIIHHWRQPLSVISTAASGLSLIKSIKRINSLEIDDTVQIILNNTKYLSDTLDNFRNLILDEKNNTIFNPNKKINKIINMLNYSIKESNINIVLNLSTDINIKSYSSKLTQIFINLINNSKDAFIKKSISNRYIFISTKILDSELIITFSDNAKGIPDKIIGKVFEPYITTKHQSRGVGLGLYLSYKIIKEQMNGNISVRNTNYFYNNKEYSGAEFNIILPISFIKV